MRAALASRRRTETRFRAMGTDVHVIALDAAPDLTARAREAVEGLEARWSRFRPGSELCRLNRAAGAPAVVTRPTFELVAKAVDAWRVTGGRFDPTILAALEAAGYDRDFAALRAAGDLGDDPSVLPGPAPGCRAIGLDPIVGAVSLPVGVRLDLGGIGKGRAADLVAGQILDAGAGGVLVNLGGDLRTAGAPPGDQGWMIEVDDPLESGEPGVLSIGSGAVATSTRLRRRWTRAGCELHHVIDPSTGRPSRSGLASVTVLAAEASWAEVLAKAALVGGETAGAALLAECDVTGLFLHDDGRTTVLPGLAAYRR